jgi:UDP-glucose 4-epimerase
MVIKKLKKNNIIILGGAGFIGSNVANFFSNLINVKKIIIYDNFSSGKKWFLKKSKKFLIINKDIKDYQSLKKYMRNCNFIFHFAANPDLAASVHNPDIDFQQGTVLFRNVIEAMRENKINKIIYASGSGVYGDKHNQSLFESKTVTKPISTYGASKLYCENLISSYSNLYNISGISFRFANVVGDNITHGVCYDFVKKIFQNNKRIKILGNGRQSKSYIHVSDVVLAIYKSFRKMKAPGHSVYNLSTKDNITVNKILNLILKIMKIKKIKKIYSGGKRGWKGDVPIVRIDDTKFRKYANWSNKFSSNEAIKNTISFLIKNKKKYNF